MGDSLQTAWIMRTIVIDYMKDPLDVFSLGMAMRPIRMVCLRRGYMKAVNLRHHSAWTGTSPTSMKNGKKDYSVKLITEGWFEPVVPLDKTLRNICMHGSGEAVLDFCRLFNLSTNAEDFRAAVNCGNMSTIHTISRTSPDSIDDGTLYWCLSTLLRDETPTDKSGPLFVLCKQFASRLTKGGWYASGWGSRDILKRLIDTDNVCSLNQVAYVLKWNMMDVIGHAMKNATPDVVRAVSHSLEND